MSTPGPEATVDVPIDVTRVSARTAARLGQQIGELTARNEQLTEAVEVVVAQRDEARAKVTELLAAQNEANPAAAR